MIPISQFPIIFPSISFHNNIVALTIQPYCLQFKLMSQIRYRISSISSEDSKYPASNLMYNQQGWQSAKNCSYQQSITIQFFVPIRTRKLHLLFHQYKIPKIVEIFVKLGRQKYRKLGYITPNDNSQSSFQQKQEKTLYFQFSCTHIRLVLHQNYKNDMNIFNQVAIEDLIVVGEILGHQQLTGVDLTEAESSEEEVAESLQISHNVRSVQQQVENIAMQNLSGETLPLFRDIYAKLQQEKLQAVDRQDYQRAAHLKTILLNFKSLQNEMNRLQRQKAQALRVEDYDRCHRLKHQLTKKRQIVEFQKQELFRNQQPFIAQNSYSRIMENDISPINDKSKESVREMLQFKSPQPEKKQTINNGSKLHDDQVVPALLKKGKNNYQNLPLQTNQKRRDGSLDINQSAIPEVVNQNDCASVRKDLNQLNSQYAQTSIKIELQPLQVKLKMRLQNYFGFIPQIIWQYCQNKNWRGKLQAINFIKERVSLVQTKQQFMGSLQMISRTIVSKQAVISIEALQILNKLTDNPIRFTLQHVPFFVQDIIAEMLNFLNDTNNKIKELAYTTYIKLPQISFLNAGVVIRELIKHKNRVKSDPKLLITKITLMNVIIQRYNQQVEQSARQILNWITCYIDDPNQKVRTQAIELITTVTFLVGYDKVLKIIETTKPQCLQLLLTLMNNSMEQSKLNVESSKINQHSRLQNQFYGKDIGSKSYKNPSSSIVSAKNAVEKPIFVLENQDKNSKLQQSKSSKRDPNMNIDLSYSKQSIFEQSAQPSHIPGNDSHDYSDEDNIRVYQQDGICQYCGQKFQNQKEHYIKECRVLAYCQKCNGVIYLREFTQHLLKECQLSHQYRQCKKCGLAFELDEINEHIGKDTCKKKNGFNWERCQFCSADVLGQDRFWIQHAMVCNSLPNKQESLMHDSQMSQDQNSMRQ